MIDFNKMFEAAPTVNNHTFDTVPFQTSVHDPAYEELFKVTRNASFQFPVSPEEEELKAFEPTANFGEHKKWLEHWDTKFQEIVDTNNKLTNELLDMNQEIARHDQEQKATFDEIMGMVKDVQERVSPPDSSWSFFKKKPKEMSHKDWDDFIDAMQARLNKINPKLDHFLNGKIGKLIEDSRLAIVSANHAMNTLRFKHHKDPTDDQNNRRMERLARVKALLEVSKNGLESLRTSVSDKQENLTDFKVVAVPTILNQLSSAIANRGDNNQFAALLASQI